MTTCHVFIATSLDGFVARTDYGLDWLNRFNTSDEDHGYEEFVAGVNGLVMGRGSYETVLSFDDWPYRKPVVVMSKSLAEVDIPAELEGKVRLTRLEPSELMRELDDEGWRRAYVDGGRLVQSFLREGLIADLTITTVPVLIGSGIRLFGELTEDVRLELVRSQAFGSGLVQSHYRVVD